jgi:hypothetical protein
MEIDQAFQMNSMDKREHTMIYHGSPGGSTQYNYAMFYITALKGIEGGVYSWSSGTCPIREWWLSKINKRLASAPLREQR